MDSNPRQREERSRTEQTGATAVEYALMVAFIAIVIVASVMALGIGVDGLFAPVAPAL